MSGQVICPGCKTNLVVNSERTGNRIKCPTCQKVLHLRGATGHAVKRTQSPAKTSPVHKQAVPASTADAKIVTQCQCGAKLNVASRLLGKKVRCPKCRGVITVAAPQTHSAQPPPQPAPQSLAPIDEIKWGDLPPAEPSAVSNFIPTTAPVLAPQPRSDSRLSGSGSNVGSVVAAEQLANAQAEIHNQRHREYQDDEPKSWFATRLNMFAMGIVVAGAFIAFSGCRDEMTASAIDADGATVPGIILSGEERRRRKSFATYYTLEVAYRTEAGETFTKDFRVTSSYFDAHTDLTSITNEHCEVVYSQSSPETAVISGGSTGLGGGLLKIVTGIAMILTGCGGVMLLRWIDFD